MVVTAAVMLFFGADCVERMGAGGSAFLDDDSAQLIVEENLYYSPR